MNNKRNRTFPAAGAAALLGMMAWTPSASAGTPVSSSPVFTHEGEVGYVTAAVALRTAWKNKLNSRPTGNNSMKVTLPNEVSVRQAILYWGTDASGGDNRVTLAGNTVTAQASWSDTLRILFSSQTYHGYRADVTSIVNGSGTYTFGNLAYDTMNSTLGACLNGAMLIVVYDAAPGDPNLLNRIDIFEGFEAIRGSGGASGGGSASASLPLNLSNANKVMATTMSWQGNSKSEWFGFKDSMVLNGTSLSGSGNPSDDAGNGSGAGGSPNSQYAVDVDTFDVTSAASGASSLTFTNSSTQDDYLIVQGFVLGAAGGMDASDAPVATHGLATHGTSGNSLKIGRHRDSETLLSSYAGNVDATADDTRSGDDEDAFGSFPTLHVNDTTYSVTVNCTGSGTLAGWIDFNQSGGFEASERASATTSGGNVTLTWSGLTGLVDGETYARFRFAASASQVSSPVGNASSGEVEDHRITIDPAPPGPNLFYTYYFSNDDAAPVATSQFFDELPTGLVWNPDYEPVITGGLQNVNVSYSNGNRKATVTSMVVLPGNASITLCTMPVDPGTYVNSSTLTLENGETLEPEGGDTTIVVPPAGQ